MPLWAAAVPSWYADGTSADGTSADGLSVTPCRHVQKCRRHALPSYPWPSWSEGLPSCRADGTSAAVMPSRSKMPPSWSVDGTSADGLSVTPCRWFVCRRHGLPSHRAAVMVCRADVPSYPWPLLRTMERLPPSWYADGTSDAVRWFVMPGLKVCNADGSSHRATVMVCRWNVCRWIVCLYKT